MAYSAHSREDSHSSYYPRAPVSNSRHASPEAELEDHSQTHGKHDSASALSDGHRTSSSAGAGEASAQQHTSNGSSGTTTVTGLYDGASPFFGSSGIHSSSTRRFPSPYGTPVSTPGAGGFYPPLSISSSLQANGSRSPYPPYIQQQSLLNRTQHHNYAHDTQQGLHNPVIAPSYLQQQHHSNHPSSSANMQHSVFANGVSTLVHSNVNISQGSPSNVLVTAVDSALGEIDDDDEEEDGEEDSSAEDESSFGDDPAFQEDTLDTNTRKRRRKAGSTQIVKGSTANVKKVKAEDGAPATKANRKGKGKADMPVKDDADSKSKSTRGSKACTVCRRLKMRCEPAPDGDESKCKRCRAGGHECVFEESQRGRRKNIKADAMAKSIRNMENTLETVLKAIATGNTHTVAGMSLGVDGNLIAATSQSAPAPAPTISPQPSATPQVNLSSLPNIDPSLTKVAYPSISPGHHARSAEGDLMSNGLPDGFSNTAPTSHGVFQIKTEESLNGGNGQGGSPALRLHSLPEPENTWAPLGLLAEASLENNQSKRRRSTFTASDLPNNLSAMDEIRQARAREGEDRTGDTGKLGVANDAYFQPGPFNSTSYLLLRGLSLCVTRCPTVLPLRQLMIDKNLPSPLLTERIITVEEAVMLFNLCVHIKLSSLLLAPLTI